MNIAVIAASGRSGRAFVEVALAAGHSVRAGARTTSSLPPAPNLTIVKCDATNIEDIRQLIAGQDAVVSLIGHVKGSPADVQSNAIQNVIHAAQDSGLRRLVSLTGTGVRFPGDKITLIDKILNAGISIIDPARIQDGKHHVELLKSSNLDWTIIRVLKLQNVAPRPFILTENGPTKIYVGREEVAKAILHVLEDDSFIHRAPIISKA